MSNTYRKGRKYHFYWNGTDNEAKAVDKAVTEWKQDPTKFVWVYKTKEEYERDCRKNDADYERRLKEYAREHHISINAARAARRASHWPISHYLAVVKYRVNKKKRIQVDVTYEEVVAEAKEKFAKRSRDGYWNETSRNTGFKKEATRILRRANKRLTQDIMRDEDWEDIPYPNRKNGKACRWNWW